jgi:WD40 repeat protein
MNVGLLLVLAVGPPWPMLERVPVPSFPKTLDPMHTEVVFAGKGERLAVVLRFEEEFKQHPELWDLHTTRRTRFGLRKDHSGPSRLFPTRRGEWIGVWTDSIIHWDANGKQLKRREIDLPDAAETIMLDAEEKRLVAFHHRHRSAFSLSLGKEVSKTVYPTRPSHTVKVREGFLVVLEHQDVDLWDPHTGKLLRSFEDHPGRVRDALLTAEQKTLVAVWERPKERRGQAGVIVWDMATGKQKHAFESDDPLQPVAISPSGEFLAAWTGRSIFLFRLPSGEPIHENRANNPERLLFSPDGRYLVGVGSGLEIWRVRPLPR